MLNAKAMESGVKQYLDAKVRKGVFIQFFSTSGTVQVTQISILTHFQNL